MQSFNYPLLFEPIYVPRPWGGRRLESLYGRKLPDGKVGEAWDISDWPMEGDLVTSTKIANGPLAGSTLDDLFDPFPIVLKLLDAHETLSVQAHPVPGCCEAHGKPVDSKNEMWYVLYADPDAFLYLGLADGVSADDFCDALKSGSDEERIVSMIKKVPVTQGTYLNVPSGTIHAVGAGIVAFEVSQRTQVTYRLYDWGRKPERQLHIEDGCKAVSAGEKWNPGTGMDSGLDVEGSQVNVITQFPTFAVSVAKPVDGKLKVSSAKRPHILTPIGGDLKFISGDGLWREVSIKKSESVLVPAVDNGYEAEVTGDVLVTTV